MDIDTDRILIESFGPLEDFNGYITLVEIYFWYKGEKLRVVRKECEILSLVNDCTKITEGEKDMLFMCYPQIERHIVMMIIADAQRKPLTWAEKEELGD